jgi:hypothetical protein
MNAAKLLLVGFIALAITAVISFFVLQVERMPSERNVRGSPAPAETIPPSDF